MDIKTFVKEVGLEDKLPFVINFEIKPSIKEAPTTKVGSFNFPTFKALTVKETYIFEALEEHSGYNANVAALEVAIIGLAKELSIAISEPDLVKCVNYVYSTPEEVVNHENFAKYIELTSDLREELTTISKSLSNPMLGWAKITFFILARVDANWSFDDTTNLTSEELIAISEFIESERNPEPEVLEGFESEGDSQVTELPEGK